MGLKEVYLELRNLLIVVITPIVLLPLALSDRSESKCAFVVLLMAIYWISECLPLPVTSFIPIFLFPLLGIISVDKTCEQYLKSANFLFVGGLIVAIATEETNLHKRLALSVLLMMGPQPRWLMLGFMIPTALLSMWMSNVATVAMMAPIATCVLAELIAHSRASMGSVSKERNGHLYNQIDKVSPCKVELLTINKNSTAHDESDKESEAIGNNMFLSVGLQTEGEAKKSVKVDETLNLEGLDRNMIGLCKAIMLSICYSASLGGTGTLIGTSPNIVLVGQLKDLYPNQDKVNFLSWVAFAIPPMIVCLILCWLVLLCVFVGWRSVFRPQLHNKSGVHSDDGITSILRAKYAELGSMSFGEWSIISWFSFLVFVWVFRNPLFMPGWPVWLNLNSKLIQDSVGAMLVSTVLFVWPKDKPFSKDKSKKHGPLMTWDAIKRKFPWSVVILLGGGYALAKGVEESQLATWVGCAMVKATSGMSRYVISFIMVCLVTLITQIASNSATATVFIPVLAKMADLSGTNPLFFLLPCVVAVSYAFVLPVSTPPNAVIFEYKTMQLKDMVVAGSTLCILCVSVIMLTMYAVADPLFDMGQIPDWARLSKNISCAY